MTRLETFRWDVTLEMHEDGDHCEVTAHLDTKDRSFSGSGRSHRNPHDPEVPQIGEQLATARALQDLAHHLTDDAWMMIQRFQTTR
jgi:hypothetical protein